MPCSEYHGKDLIRDWLKKQDDIDTIVDFGPGAGVYPKFLGSSTYTWIGVEVWAPYVEQFNLHELYDEIIIGDIRHVKLPDGDLAILGDVVEHLPKHDAKAVLSEVYRKYKHVIISIPIGMMEQGKEFGNKYETHLSYWSFKELEEWTPNFEIREQIKNAGIFIK